MANTLIRHLLSSRLIEVSCKIDFFENLPLDLCSLYFCVQVLQNITIRFRDNANLFKSLPLTSNAVLTSKIKLTDATTKNGKYVVFTVVTVAISFISDSL